MNQEVSAFQTGRIPFNWEQLSNQYTIRNFTVKDGLSLNSANYIVQHSSGFIYIATYDGLVQFDGDKFLVFNTSNTPEMQSNRISWIGVGANGDLWFLDSVYNLYRLKKGRIEWFQKKERYTDLKVNKIAVLNNTKVMLTTNKGLFMQGEGLNFNPFNDGRVQTSLINTYVEKGSLIHFIKEEGLFQIRDEKVIHRLSEKELDISTSEIFNMIATRDGTLWLLGKQSQLIKITPDDIQHAYSFKELGKAIFWDFTELSHEKLLISSSKGYVMFSRETEEFSFAGQGAESEEYFVNNAWNKREGKLVTKLGNQIFINGDEILETQRPVINLALDNEGGIWIATNGDGVYQINPKRIITIGNDMYPGLQNIYGLAEDNENIWAASFEHQIFRINDTSLTNWNRKNSGIEDTFFRSVWAAGDGTVSGGSFILWKLQKGHWNRDFTYSNGGQQIDVQYEDSRNRYWIGTDAGLYLSSQKKYELYHDINGQSLGAVRSMTELENGELALATGGMGVAFLSKQEEFRFITVGDGLSSNLVRDLYIASPDTMWVVSEDQGLNRIIINSENKVQEVEHVSIEDGLIDNSLHRLLKDDFGYFWINSNKGIMRVKEQALNDYIDGKREELLIESFGEEEGLVNIEGNGGVQNAGIMTSDGKLLFPNQAGIVYTKPEWHIRQNERALTKPVIQTISFNDTTLSSYDEDRILLPKSVRDIQVKFTIPVFSNPHKLEMYYKMEGVNDIWHRTGEERLAVFTNLPSGENKLLIRGRRAGSDQYSENSFVITIPPYFYETVWFGVLAVMGLIMLFIAGFLILLRQSKRREKKLNELVEERTRQLVEEKEKTEQALQQVQKLDESKSRFFTNFTHELRTPLSLILNPLEDMLEDDELELNGNRESLTLMKRNAVRLKDLVSQLLDVSKLNAGELSLSFEPVDLGLLTRQFAAQFEHSMLKKRIQFSMKGSANTFHVYVDVNAWQHVCTNLLSNALKFTPEKGSISIAFEESSHHISVFIKDSGIGVPPKDIPFIFDSYYQGDSSISKAEGTGIGLALVKGLVQRMGGTIAVDSELEEGTVFTIRLKKGKAHIKASGIIKDKFVTKKIIQPHNQAGIVRNTKILSPADAKSVSKAKVLLVEDNEDYRGYLYSVIGRHYQIEVAKNGREGLEALARIEPDIIISDIMMPEMDGYQMMKSIRNQEVYRTIPFIFLSAKDSAAEIEKGLNIGADIYLPKPVQNKLLLTQIKVLLRREQSMNHVERIKESEYLSPLIREVQEIIQRHLGNPDLNVELIAEALSMSSASLYRKWKKQNENGATINQTISKLRFDEAIKLVKEEKFTVSEAAYSVGFSHLSYFSKAFKKMYGLSPIEYLKKHQ